MSKKDELRKSLESARKNLNDQGISYDGTGGIANWESIKPFEVAYQDCIEKIWPHNAWWKLTNYWDIFDEMASGVSDKDIINEIIDHIDESKIKNEALEISEEDPKPVTESKELKEGTSNFGSDGGADFLPLLVFMEYEVVEEQCRNAAQEAYDALDDETVDWDNFVDNFEDKHFDEYSDGICVLDESQVDDLKDDLYTFNEKLHNRGIDLMDGAGNDDGKPKDDEYDRGSILDGTDVEIIPGYYSGAYLNCDFDTKDVTNGEHELSEDDKKLISDFFSEMQKKYGLTKLGVDWKASNGETGYSIKEGNIDEKKIKQRYTGGKVHLNKNAGDPVKNMAFFNHAVSADGGSSVASSVPAGATPAGAVSVGGASVGGASEALETSKNSALSHYDDLFEQWLIITEFDLIKNDDGTYSLHDEQGANLGDIESDTFTSAEDILERMDIYVSDYLLDDLEEEADSYDVDFGDKEASTCEEWYNLMKDPDFIKKNKQFVDDHDGDIDFLDLIVNGADKVDLNKVYDDVHKNDKAPEEPDTKIIKRLSSDDVKYIMTSLASKVNDDVLKKLGDCLKDIIAKDGKSGDIVSVWDSLSETARASAKDCILDCIKKNIHESVEKKSVFSDAGEKFIKHKHDIRR